jgi:hypothetical protein
MQYALGPAHPHCFPGKNWHKVQKKKTFFKNAASKRVLEAQEGEAGKRITSIYL